MHRATGPSARASRSWRPPWRSTSACSGCSSTTASSSTRSARSSTRSASACRCPLLTLALPIGLSFITFQAISYVVDVKRGLLAPAPTLDFALYLSFFPHVVAGPIVRAREFIPQLATPRNPSDVAVGAGVVLIAIGLVKKVAIADYLAREVVDPVFGVPEAYAAPDVALAAYAYAAQIYCDFSGLHRHRDRRRAADGVRLPPELQQPLPGARASATSGGAGTSRCRASCATSSTSRSAATAAASWQTGPQPDDHDAARRPLARRGLGLRALGRPPRRLPRGRARAARRGVPAPPAWRRAG